MKIVGQRLKELRVNARYSQKQIAEKCDTTQVTIGRYETGVAEPPLQKLLWYAEFFDVSLDYIFGRTDNPQGMKNTQQLNQHLRRMVAWKRSWKCASPQVRRSMTG